MLLFGQPIVQVAYFTSNARTAAERAVATFGAGPFFVLDRIALEWGEHRGVPRTFVHSSAYGQWGDVMMECVQQDEEGPSPFRDLYAPGQEGIHHVALMVASLEASIRHFAERGFPVAARAATETGTEFVFIDTAAALGHYVEIYERSDALVGFYDFVRQSAVNWDGREPVRTLGTEAN